MSGKVAKFVTGVETLLSGQSRMIEQVTSTYSRLGKALDKQRKTIEDQRRKQAEAKKVLKPDVLLSTINDEIPKDYLSKEAKN